MERKVAQEALKGMQSNWKGTIAERKAFANGIPEGEYYGTLKKLEVNVNKKKAVVIAYSLKISEGDEKGAVVRDKFNIEHEVGMSFFQQFISMHELEVPAKITEVPAVLDEIVAAESLYKLEVTKSGDWTNTKIVEIVGNAEADEEENDEYTAEDIDGMKRTELVDLIDDEELDIDEEDYPKAKGLRAAIKEELGLVEADEEEEEEEEEAPALNVKKKKAKPAPEPDEDEDDDEPDEDEDDDEPDDEPDEDEDDEDEDDEDGEELVPTAKKKRKAKPAAAAAPAPLTASKIKKGLLSLIASQGLEEDAEEDEIDTSSIKQVKKFISEYDFDASELTEAEVDLLTQAGLEAVIITDED